MHTLILYTAASAPTNVKAVQEGLTVIRVSWTPPTPLGDTTGYRIYYSGGSSGSVDVSGGSTHDYLLFGLINGTNYNISIVGASKHLPSNLVSYPNRIPLSELVLNFNLHDVLSHIFIFIYSTVSLSEKPSGIMVTSSTSTKLSLTWIVLNHSLEIFMLAWERDDLEKCPKKDNGSVIITNGSTSYTITGLEEDSNYTITVAAINAAGSTFSDPITGMTLEAGMYWTMYIINVKLVGS